MFTAKMLNRSLLLAALCAVLTGALQQAQAAEPAAEVTRVVGSVTAVTETGRSRPLFKGSDLFQGDRIETESASSVAMRFTDDSVFNLGENAAMGVDAYKYQKDSKKNSFVSSIFKGAFRFVSGLVARAKSRAMGVRTPVATIGIRGTHVAGEADATSARIMLLAPEGEARPTSIEVSNEFGSVVVDEPGYGTEVADANSAPTPPRRMQLRTVQNLMRTMQSIGRIRPPPTIRPRMRH